MGAVSTGGGGRTSGDGADGPAGAEDESPTLFKEESPTMFEARGRWALGTLLGRARSALATRRALVFPRSAGRSPVYA